MHFFTNRKTIAQTSRRWLLTAVVATLLALSASYAPIVLDGIAGAHLTDTVFACGHPPGEC